MIKVGDKVIVLPTSELDANKCDANKFGVYGIGIKFYNEYVGKEYIVKNIDIEEFVTCELESDEMELYFPIGCLKKIK